MNIPSRLGKYPVTDVLGKGAMGIVYKGYDPVIRRPVAIKTIRKELIEDDERAESLSMRFRREAQAAGTLNHPGIVAVYEYGEDDVHAFIAMEYVEGNTLREYFTRGHVFDEADTVSIMAQLLDALDYAHQMAIWHRDVKPSNLIIMRNGRVKLADFGIARVEAADRTRTDVIMGTPGYIAPEHYLGGTVDHRIDLFASGVLFYHLLSGKLPFGGGKAEAAMHDVCYHDPDPPSRADPHHRWPQYDAVVARAIEKAPSKRYASAGEFRAALLAQYAQPVHGAVSAEATIISAAPRPVAIEAGTPSVPRSSATQATSTPPPTGWSATVLAGIELQLARFVGPVAKVLVRRAARNQQRVDSLVNELLENIDAAADREAFVKLVLGPGGGTPVAGLQASGPAANASAGPAVSDEDVERAIRLLTVYIGPIAKVVVRRAAAGGASRQQFLDQVAQSLETEAERERFLRDSRSASSR